MAVHHSAPSLAGQHLAGSPDNAPAAGAGRYIVGNWSHIFADDDNFTDVRIAFDTISQRLVAMQIHTRRGYVDAGREQLAEAENHLLHAYPFVLRPPIAAGLERATEMPDWSTQECRNAAIVQFERKIAFCKVQHGILIGQLALELEARDEDAIDELRWDVVDAAKGGLASAAANASTDNPDDQENAIARAEAWVAEHVSNGTLLDLLAASIALSSANDTQAAVFQLLSAPAAAPGGA